MKAKYHWLNATTPVLAALVITGASQLTAQTILNDDFESYADQTAFEDALNGGWADMSGPAGNQGLALSTERNFLPSGGAQCVRQSISSQRSSKTFPSGTEFTQDSQVHAKVTFYIFATNAPTGTTGPSRVQAGVTTAANGAPTTLGWLNQATGYGQAFSNFLFQGRCDYGPTTIGAYFNLTNAGCPTRAQALGSSGNWVKFDIERITNGVTRYYVNDVMGASIPSTNGAWGAAAIGFNAGTQVGDSWYDGYSIVTNHPYVVTQPTNQYPAIGGSATFSVVADNATTYQWRKNVTNDITGATSSSYTINNVQNSDVAFYTVVVGNANGVIGTRAAQLIIGPPSIQSQSTNVSTLEGGVLSASVAASGAPTLKYQWYFGSTAVTSGTGSTLTKNPFLQPDVGTYTCVVTNTFGAVTSSPVAATMITNLYPDAITPLWTKLPGDYSWLKTSGSETRSLGYNVLSNQVLVATRAGTNIHVLNGDTGAFLYSLANPETFDVGFFVINKLALAEDGAVYICNLTLNGTTTNFKLYRYADTGSTTAPTVIYDGDPGAGVVERWGDTLAARGEGAGTQLIITSRTGTNACVFTTDGSTWTPHLLGCNVGASDLGSGVAFGVGDTFWAKSNDGASNGLYRIGFDLNAATTTVLARSTNVPNSVTAIGVNKAGCFLMANEVAPVDAARFYDVSSYAADPILVDWAFFTPRNTGFGAGNLIITPNRIYAIEDNNGILALKVNWPKITFSASGSDLIMDWVGTYTLESATTVDGTFAPVPGPVTEGPYINSTGPTKFFRLKY